MNGPRANRTTSVGWCFSNDFGVLGEVNGEFAYEISAASSWTVIEMVVELLSAELFAQTVNIAVEVTVVGVP